ncbi:hypothetical protein R1sor_024911 [Riccia sorocarpa]|uniref:GDT1 family protein n=1 Tax=Riccia sorocarpa TaxID=122646 RepID=A0ABD3GV17_9MARC
MQSVCAAHGVRPFGQASYPSSVVPSSCSSSRNSLYSAKSLGWNQERLRIWKLVVNLPAELNNRTGARLNDGRLTVEASTSSVGPADDGDGISSSVENSGFSSSDSESQSALQQGKNKGTLEVVGSVSAVLAIAAAAALALTLRNGGPGALLSTVSRSGFPAAFSLIFISEIGDKTFFIAALLAMRHNKWLVLLGASGALSVMTVISVIIGRLFRKVPASLQTTLPIGEYAAVALLVWFGLRSIKSAWDIPSPPADEKTAQTQEIGELAEAEEFLKQANKKDLSTPLEILAEAFSLIFVAEWGDRSMLATIALGAAQSPWGVASGATVGHVLATLLAVVGGALLARYLSEKMIGYFGGFLFLGFAAATLAGVF